MRTAPNAEAWGPFRKVARRCTSETRPASIAGQKANQTMRNLVLLNLAIPGLLVVAIIFGLNQALTGPMFDGRGVVALLALLVAAFLSGVRSVIERDQ